MGADPRNSEVYADIGELYIRECVAVGDSTTSDYDGHKEREDQGRGGTGVTTSSDNHDRGRNVEQEEGITRTELDRRKSVLLETYTRFYKQLWPDKQPETIRDLSYNSPRATDVKNKSREFWDAVRKFGIERITEEICVFYNTIEISGANQKKKKAQDSKQKKEAQDSKQKKKAKDSKQKSNTALNLWDPNPEVKLQVSGRGTITLKWHDATQGYLDQYYPDDGVYRIPATLEVEDEITYGTSNTEDPPNRGEMTPTAAKAEQKKGRRVGLEGRNFPNTLPDARGTNIIPSKMCAPGRDNQEESKSNSTTKGKVKGKKPGVGDLSLRTERERKELLSTTFCMLPEEEQDKKEQYYRREKAHKAEEKMLSALEQWGKQLQLNMFIIGGYSFDAFFKHVVGQPLYISELYNGEFDILILCQELGVILVEVKSSVAERCGEGNTEAATDADSTKRFGHRETASLSTIAKDLGKAWGQLMKRNFAVREMNRDLRYVKGLPVKAFIGVPFLTTADLSRVRICPSHAKYMICKEQLSNLDEWLLGHFPSLKYHKKNISQEPKIRSRGETFDMCFSRNDYRELVSRFVGRVSAVTAETDTIRYTSRKMTCAFLTPKQISVRDTGREHTAIFGDYGTGKTLLMIKKALELAISRDRGANEKIRVHYVPCCDVSNFEACYGMTFSHQAEFVRKFLDKLDKEQSECIVCYKCFLDFFKTVTGSSKTRVFGIEMVEEAIRSAIDNGNEDNVKHHFFFDEFPIQSLQDGGLQKIYNSVKYVSDLNGGLFPKDNELKELQNGYLWVSIATHSLGVSPSSDPSKALRDKLKVMPNEVSYVYLDKVMRVSKQVYEMVRLIEGYIEKGHGMLSNLGHMVQGMKPRLYRLPPRECGTEATTLGCECGCIRKRMSATLRRIIESLEIQDGKNTVEVTIMLYYVMSSPMFNRMYSLLNAVTNDISVDYQGDKIITLEWNTMQYHAKSNAEPIFLDGLALSDGAEGRGVAGNSSLVSAPKLSATELVDSHQLFLDYKKPSNDGASGEMKPDAGGETPLMSVPDLDDVMSGDNLHTDMGGPEEKGSPTPKCNNKEVKIRVVDQRTFAGCETPVLIFIDPFEMRHWFKRGRGTGSGYHSLIFTRCTGHFILITWPKDEAHVMWEKHLDEYGEEIDRSDASERYKQGRRHYIDSGRAAHSITGETCLDLLLKENAIEDRSFEAAPFGDVE